MTDYTPKAIRNMTIQERIVGMMELEKEREESLRVSIELTEDLLRVSIELTEDLLKRLKKELREKYN